MNSRVITKENKKEIAHRIKQIRKEFDKQLERLEMNKDEN